MSGDVTDRLEGLRGAEKLRAQVRKNMEKRISEIMESPEVRERIDREVRERVELSVSSGVKEQEGQRNLSHVSVYDLGLSRRTSNALVRGGIRTVGDLIKIPEHRLKLLTGIGLRGSEAIIEVLTGMKALRS